MKLEILVTAEVYHYKKVTLLPVSCLCFKYFSLCSLNLYEQLINHSMITDFKHKKLINISLLGIGIAHERINYSLWYEVQLGSFIVILTLTNSQPIHATLNIN